MFSWIEIMAEIQKEYVFYHYQFDLWKFILILFDAVI